MPLVVALGLPPPLVTGSATGDGLAPPPPLASPLRHDLRHVPHAMGVVFLPPAKFFSAIVLSS